MCKLLTVSTCKRDMLLPANLHSNAYLPKITEIRECEQIVGSTTVNGLNSRMRNPL